MSRPEHNIKNHKENPKGACKTCGSTTFKKIRIYKSPLNKQLENTDHFVCRNCLRKYGTGTNMGDFLIKRMGLKEFAKSV